MDNATFHKISYLKHIVEENNNTLSTPNIHSPDLNPIEPKWPQDKAYRKKYQCFTLCLHHIHCSNFISV